MPPISSNSLSNPLQTGFHSHHSSETALIWDTNDLSVAKFSGKFSVLNYLTCQQHLVQLITLSCVTSFFLGICNNTIAWFPSNLSTTPSQSPLLVTLGPCRRSTDNAPSSVTALQPPSVLRLYIPQKLMTPKCPSRPNPFTRSPDSHICLLTHYVTWVSNTQLKFNMSNMELRFLLTNLLHFSTSVHGNSILSIAAPKTPGVSFTLLFIAPTVSNVLENPLCLHSTSKIWSFLTTSTANLSAKAVIMFPRLLQ